MCKPDSASICGLKKRSELVMVGSPVELIVQKVAPLMVKVKQASEDKVTAED